MLVARRIVFLSLFFGQLLFLGSIATADEQLKPVAGQVQDAVYRKTPQAELKMQLHFPADWRAGDQRPAIVFFFGGGWTGGRVEQFEEQAKYLATRGMVAARADYRVKSRHMVMPDECVKDAQAAVRWLRRHASELGIDPQKIIASGGSAGGHLAACTALAPLGENEVSCQPCALVLFNPVLQFNGVGSLMSRIDGNEELGKKISPTLHVQKSTPPALLMFGTADTLLAQGKDYLAAAEKAGSRAELFTAEGVGHGFFNRSPWRERTLLRADEFLSSLGYLQGPPTVKVPVEK